MDLSQGNIDSVERLKNAFRNAVIADQVGLAEAFLRHGLKLDPTDIKSGVGDILSDATYFTNDPKMIRLLLAHGAKPAGDAHDRNSTLNFSLRSGNKEICDLLIAAGAACDPIFYDAALGQLDDLKARDAKAPLDVKEIRHARDYALDAGQVETFDWLWAKSQTADTAKAKILSDSYNRAADNGRLQMLVHLEKMGVKPADGGAKALAEAIIWNHVPVVQHLLENGVVLPTKPDPMKYGFPVRDAAGEGHFDMLKLLLAHGADLNATDSEGMTPLSWAAYNGEEEVCDYLIGQGANLDIPDKYGRTAVWSAAGSSHCPVALELMLKKGAHFAWVDSHGRGLFEAAMQFTAPQLGGVGFPGNVLTPKEQQAYDAREERVVDLLISAGLDPSGRKGTDSPLKTTFIFNHYPAARALLRNHPNVSVKDGQGNPAIVYLFNDCHSTFPLDVLESLLAQGADPNGSYPMPGLTPPVQFTVLQTALGFRDSGGNQTADQRAAVATLVDHGARFPGVKSAADQAVLLAAAKGDLAQIQSAISQGGSANAYDSFGYSPLLISMNLRYFDNVMWLLNHGGDPVKTRTMWGESLLPSAVSANRTDMVELLLAKGVSPRGGISGLGIAVQNGNRKIFDDLLKAGANPHDASLFTCIQSGQPEMAQILLDRGVDPQPPPLMENRANVYWAVYYGQPKILQGLLDHGADPTMVDAYKETPLSMAKEFHKEMVPMLEAAIQRWQTKKH